MTTEPRFDPERANFAYKLLSDAGAIHIEASDEQEEEMVLDYVLNNFVANAEGAQTSSESERRSRTTSALGQQAYLSAYLSWGSEDELRAVMKERKWSTGQRVDVVASKAVKAYVKLFHLPRDEEYTPDSRATYESEEPELSPTNHEQPNELKDLDSTIFNLIDERMIPESYGGHLRILLGTVDIPEGTPKAVVDSIYSQVKGLLQVHLTKMNSDLIDNDDASNGVLYLRQIARGSTIPGLVHFQKEAMKEESDVDIKELIRSQIAYGLEAMYIRPMKSEQELVD